MFNESNGWIEENPALSNTDTAGCEAFANSKTSVFYTALHLKAFSLPLVGHVPTAAVLSAQHA